MVYKVVLLSCAGRELMLTILGACVVYTVYRKCICCACCRGLEDCYALFPACCKEHLYFLRVRCINVCTAVVGVVYTVYGNACLCINRENLDVGGLFFPACCYEHITLLSVVGVDVLTTVSVIQTISYDSLVVCSGISKINLPSLLASFVCFSCRSRNLTEECHICVDALNGCLYFL